MCSVFYISGRDKRNLKKLALSATETNGERDERANFN